jgi:hypothetical protein
MSPEENDALEVKDENGRAANEQVDFGRSMIAAGADYHVVRSIDDVQRAGL